MNKESVNVAQSFEGGEITTSTAIWMDIIYGQSAIGHGNSFASKEDTTVAKMVRLSKKHFLKLNGK